MRKATSYYQANKWQEYDFYLKETRAEPIAAYPSLSIWSFLKKVEIQYRKGSINRQRAAIIGAEIRRLTGMHYRIISEKHIVFLPCNNQIVENTIFKYPQLIAIVGNRNSGKTITSWTWALKFLEKFPTGRIYVYGDIDGIAAAIVQIKPELEGRIITRKNNELPPLDGRPKLALYNELIKASLSKRATSSGNLELNFQSLRSRHRNTWVIYNIIRYTLLESTLRETSDIQVFKWMSPQLLKNVLGIMPKPVGEIIKVTTRFKVNESLVMLPVQGKGIYYGVYHTRAPAYLLKAQKSATKNKLLMMTKSETEAAVMQKIIDMKESGKSGEEIAKALREDGITLTSRAINMRYKKWKELSQ